MKILITADLHYDISRSRPGTVELASSVVSEGGDVLVLAGDIAGKNLSDLSDCLELFDKFSGLKLLVPGNHDLWTDGGDGGAGSMERYEHSIPRLASQHDFDVLDHNPRVIGDVGLVGSIGWYDYSFRDESLGVPLDFYRNKIAPGAAKYYGGYEEILRKHAESLGEKQMSLAARWRDGVKVSLGVSDEAFVERLSSTLAGQIAEIAPRVQRIAAFVHHLPFGELVPADRPPKFTFAAAFMGSEKLGNALLSCEKVRHLYCGHSHWAAKARVKHIEAVNIGSTYLEKKLEILNC